MGGDVKHVLKPTCRNGCRFLQISDELWLCPHASYGQQTYMKGAVEEARRLLERQGGYDQVLAGIVEAENARKKQKRADEAEGRKRITAAVRYES